MSWSTASLSRNSSQASLSRNYAAPSSGPFCTPAVNSNPNFRPTRPDNAAAKAPKPPEKPLMPYMRYSRRMWERVRASHPDLKFWEVGKIIGKMWRELSDRERQPFCDEYEIEKAEYDRQITAYHNSSAFQSYLAQKNREKSESAQPVYYEYPGVFIQPLDEETDEADWNSVRYNAFERYTRNQKILTEVTSNVAIPDLRLVVTTERVNVLRSQVTSLTQHQATLDNEYRQLVENCEKRKRRSEESRQWFKKRMKEVMDSKPILNDELFEELTDKWVHNYMSAYRTCTEKAPDVDSCASDNAEAEIVEEQKEPDSVEAAESTEETTVAEEEPTIAEEQTEEPTNVSNQDCDENTNSPTSHEAE